MIKTGLKILFLIKALFLIFISSYGQLTIVTEPTGSPLEGCDSLEVDFNFTGVNAAASINWEFGDGTTYSGANPPIHLYDTAGVFDVKLYADAQLEDSVTVYVGRNRDSLKFTYSDTAVFGCLNYAFKSKTKQVFRGFTVFNWNFGDGTLKTDTLPEFNTEHKFPDVGEYLVSLNIVDATCDNTFSRRIKVEECMDVQNFFTPNNDGNNDLFIPYTTAIGNYTLQIFSRWGSLVYESVAPSVSWDGRNAHGKECPNGRYIFVITHETKSEHTKKGVLYLYR